MQLVPNETLAKLKEWGEGNDTVRAVILTGSRANPRTQPDAFSDYDVEVFVSDKSSFMDDAWLSRFGEIMIRWPLTPMTTWSENFITRLVRFKSGIRIDFQIAETKKFDPKCYDSGFRVLVDKDGLAKSIPAPTFQEFIIRKPSEEEFLSLVNEFFWDALYVPKHLARNELPAAKYMLDSVIRFNYLQKMIEWHIGLRHDWSVSTGASGRYFKKYLDENTWHAYEATFSGADIEENWEALLAMIALFRRLAKEVAHALQYSYPEQTDAAVTNYCQGIRK